MRRYNFQPQISDMLCAQDLPGALNADDLQSEFELKELEDRPSLVKAVCAYDG